MSIISLVVAASRNGVIGRDGGLPWHIPSDLKLFKETTLGKPVIMGRKTWDSLPRKPLPGRVNIVITRQSGFEHEGAKLARSSEEAVALAGDAPEICIIGGGEIYRLFLPLAKRIYLTEVDLEAQGDTFLPELPAGAWREVRRQAFERGPKDSAAFALRVLERA